MAIKDNTAKIQMHQLSSSYYKSEQKHGDKHNGLKEPFGTEMVHPARSTW